MHKLRTLISLMLSLASISATEYVCLPYPERGMCIIDTILYHPGAELISFPTGYDHYRTAHRSVKQIVSNVTFFDEVLYEAMHRPLRVEMVQVHMKNLTLPPDLHLGNFADNSLSAVTVQAGKNYQISYLDLEKNQIEEITFLTSLVNLEVLHLGDNEISTLPGSVFASLTKLKYAYLQNNNFKSVPWTDLPQTLIHLDFFWCHVESVEFTNVSLPSLTYLELNQNSLTTINVTALLRAAPHLKEAHLLNSGMALREIDEIQETLASNNISFVEPHWFYHYCRYSDDYEFVDGKCVERQPETVDIGKAVWLSGLVFVLAAALVCVVVLTFRHMNR